MAQTLKLSLYRILAIILASIIATSNLHAMNFSWLYNTPVKKIILGAMLFNVALIYWYTTKNTTTINNTITIEGLIEYTNKKQEKTKNQLESIEKINSLKERLLALIVLLNETKKSTNSYKQDDSFSITSITIISMPNPFYKLIYDKAATLSSTFITESENPKEIKEFILQIPSESRKLFINVSLAQKNTLMHIIFKKYSDEINEHEELIKLLNKENISKDAIDFEESEKTITEYETLIQCLLHMDGDITYENGDKQTPYSLLKNEAKNRIHNVFQTILINYSIENQGQKFYEILLKLRDLGLVAKILNENDAIINAIKKDTNPSILFFCVEFGIATNINNLHNKTIIDYLVEKNDFLDFFLEEDYQLISTPLLRRPLSEMTENFLTMPYSILKRPIHMIEKIY